MASCIICEDLSSGTLVHVIEDIIRPNLADLRGSARNGCILCSILEEGMDQMGLLFHPDVQDHQVKLRIIVKSGRSVKLTLYNGVPGLFDYDEVHLEFYTEHDSLNSRWSVFGPAATVPGRLDLPLAINNIRSWLSICEQDHESCNPVFMNGGGLPRRVLDLESSNHQVAATLIDSNGLRERYVALSHCWGGDPSSTITTTAVTIAARKSGISWGELPRTFRDAVLITKGLGIRYLWIDSLCIIQEDLLDWEQESAEMASTYSNCFLNLAATHARNGTSGCISQRWTPTWTNQSDYGTLSQRQPVISHMICLGGNATGVLVRKSLDVAHAQCTSDIAHDFPLDQTAPLLSRAWCYQERLLSPRTIHFHCSEMIWHCIDAISCECGLLDNTNAVIEYGSRDTFPKHTFRLLDTYDDGRSPPHGFQIDLWLTVVHQYSKMRLTYPSDILPALGGIALRFQQQVNPGRYLAGLWENQLAVCLLWQVYSNPETNPSRKHVDTCRPASYRAPTWSWASIDFDTTYRAAVSYYEVTNYDLAMEPDFCVVSATTELDGLNEFGRVVSGMLQVRCRVIHGLLDHKSSMTAFNDGREILPDLSFAEEFTKWHEVNLDCIEQFPPEVLEYPAIEHIQPICCLIVAEFVAYGKRIAIVVQELEGNPGTFNRIGYMYLDSDLIVVGNAQARAVKLI